MRAEEGGEHGVVLVVMALQVRDAVGTHPHVAEHFVRVAHEPSCGVSHSAAQVISPDGAEEERGFGHGPVELDG